MKRIVAFVMMVCTFMTTCMLFTPSVLAASSETFDSLDISESAYYVMRDAMNKGNYNVKKMNGVWYYSFTSGSKTVYIKGSAFRGGNSGLSTVTRASSAISSAISKGQNSGDKAVIYRSCSVAYSSKHQTDIYKWDFTLYKLSAMNDNGGITFKLKRISNMRIDHQLKWRMRSSVLTFKDSSSKYTLNGGSSGSASFATLTPKFDVQITNPGTNKNYLSTYTIAGKGKATTTKNIDKLIDVGFTTASVAAKVYATKSLKISNLYSLYKAADSLKSSSSEYLSREKYSLTVGNKYVLKSTFTSPIILRSTNDYFQVSIGLRTVIGAKTAISFTLSAK